MRKQIKRYIYYFLVLLCFTFILLYYSDVSCITWQNELSAILRFGAEELFKEDKTDEETKRNLESLDIDEILERAEKVETKGGEGEEGNELLSAFKACDVYAIPMLLMLTWNYSVLIFVHILGRLLTFPVAKMMPHSGVD